MDEKFIADFFHKVKEMREAQKAYFRTRQPEALKESKMIEKEIDEILIEIQSGQTKLFK